MSIGILVDILYNVGMSKLMWNISKLRNWDKNPRAIKSNKFQELKERIKKYGQFKPVITTLDGEVIGGNMRLRAMKDLGIQEIWVSVVEPKTNAEKIEIALADNEEMGYYQEDQLAELISEYKDDIKLESFSIHLGDGVNLEDLLNKYQPEEIIEDEAPEIEEEFISELGAIYQLGNHRLMCGDSTNIEEVELLLNGIKPDLIFTDPPYGLGGYGGRNMEGIKGDNDFNIKKFYDSVFNLQTLLTRKEMYIWGNHTNLRLHLMEEPRDVIVWVKNNFGLGRGYRGQYELCFYYGKFNGSDSDVWEVKKDSKYVHPTQKPIELALRAFNNSEANIILDIYGGSGSTLIACEQSKRKSFLMELDPRYVDVIRKRYAKFIGKENEWQEVTPKIN